MNIITITGNLTSEPSYWPEKVGKESLLSFCIANNRYTEHAEKTIFLSCSAFGYVADTSFKSLYKGVGVLIEGRLDIDDECRPKILVRRIEILRHTKKHLEELGVKSTERYKTSVYNQGVSGEEGFVGINPGEKLPWE